tara:strand:+ start:316 stop:921 length:606 start_codon:yes stop_codon:yes gene_type:complete
MAIFDFLRRRKKLKEDQKLSPTKYLQGMKDSPIGMGQPEVIGKGSDPDIAPLSAPRTRLDSIKPLNIQKPKQDEREFDVEPYGFLWNKDKVKRDVRAEKPNVDIFRDRMMSRRNKRKKDAQARYEEQTAARSKRAGARKERTPEQRQKEYDEAFSRPLGENTIMGIASANIAGRQQAMIDRAAKRREEKRKKEAAKNNNNK